MYLLFGYDDESGKDAAYIGEAENVMERLLQHLTGKEFWSEVVTFSSKDSNLTKAHVRYLESRLYSIATSANRYAVLNSTTPQQAALPRGETHAMEEFISGVRTLLGVLGHRVLEPVTTYAATDAAKAVQLVNVEKAPAAIVPSPSHGMAPDSPVQAAASDLVQLTVSGLIATGRRTAEGFVVLENSEAAAQPQPSAPSSVRAIRDQLIANKALLPSGGKLRFTLPHLFNSPSQAAGVVVGYSINGLENWRTPGGKSLKDLDKAAAEEALKSFIGRDDKRPGP